jgi:hypothetical protein
VLSEQWQKGRRPKHDDFDDLDPSDDSYTGFQQESGYDNIDEEENEEVNLDNPDFEKGEMWSDYADDMDFEE